MFTRLSVFYLMKAVKLSRNVVFFKNFCRLFGNSFAWYRAPTNAPCTRLAGRLGGCQPDRDRRPKSTSVFLSPVWLGWNTQLFFGQVVSWLTVVLQVATDSQLCRILHAFACCQPEELCTWIELSGYFVD